MFDVQVYTNDFSNNLNVVFDLCLRFWGICHSPAFDWLDESWPAFAFIRTRSVWASGTSAIMAAILRNGARDELVRAGLQILADVTLSNTETAQIVITAGGVEAAVSLLQRNEALLGAREEACRSLTTVLGPPYPQVLPSLIYCHFHRWTLFLTSSS